MSVSSEEVFALHQSLYPQLVDQIQDLKNLYNSKLWHQLTGVLLKYVQDKTHDAADDSHLLTMYNNLILKLNHRLDPIKYAIITISCSRQYQSIEDSIQFLEECKVRLRGKQDALFLLEISQADKKLALGKHHDCFEQLNTIRMQIEQMSDVDPKVYAALA